MPVITVALPSLLTLFFESPITDLFKTGHISSIDEELFDNYAVDYRLVEILRRFQIV